MRIYKFYLDVFALQNIFMNGAVILLTIWSMRIPIVSRIRQVFIWDAIGTMLSGMLLILSIDYHFYELFSFLIVVPLMCYGASGLRKKNELFMMVLYSYIIAFLLGGVSQAISSRIGNFYIFSVVITFVLIGLWNKQRKERERLYVCRLEYTNPVSNKINVQYITGFFDTGNVLREGSTNKMISVVQESVLEKLGICQTPIIVRYNTVSGTETMEVYCIDALCINRSGKEIRIDSAYIGKINNQILKDKKYQMILNGGVFDEAGICEEIG